MSPSASYIPNVDIVDIRQHDFGSSLASDIHSCLNPPEGAGRSLPTTLLYDAKGLKLFEEITYLDEYYLTNAEIEVLEAHAKDIVERIPNNAQLLELGSGNLRKVEILLREFERTGKCVDYYALDLSLSELQRTFSELSTQVYEHVGFHGLHGTYDDAHAWISNPENRNRPTAVMSMGSSLGNFTRSGAAEFLSGFSKVLKPSDIMIIGLDACKDQAKIYKAYNDSQGITRQFYENGLLHANAVLGYPAFSLDEWEVVTGYDRVGGRHEAFYSPKRDVTVEGVHIQKGEKLSFEEATKYDSAERDRLWHRAGLIHKVDFGNSSDDYHIHFLSSAALNLPTRRSQYASHPIPSLEEYHSLWTAWDIVTRAMIPREELMSKPIKLRNALIFYLGHTPAFLDIHLTRALAGKPTEPKSFQAMFERGIDPDVEDPETCHSHSEIPDEWPELGHILAYQERIRNRLRSVFQLDGLAQNRLLAEALWIGFEHEAMHLETFLYMLLQSERTMPPPGVDKPDFEELFHQARTDQKPNEWFTIPKQTLSVGLDNSNDMPPASFGWDNEIPKRTVTVHAFEAQARPITNGEFAKYLEANQIGETPVAWMLTRPEDYPASNGINGSGGDATEFMSRFAVRTVFGPVPLKFAQDWPVMASYDELNGYARWANCRIPTFEEARSIYSCASQFTEAERNNRSNGHSNGVNGVNGYDTGKPRSPDHQPVQIPASTMPVFIDLDDSNIGFKHWHPTPVIQNGDKLAGQGELGGVWEWTSSPLAPHEGYKPMEIYPGYSSDFLDGKHNVVLGGSWATHPRIAGRTTFVNWYQHNYPYVWAGARLVRDVESRHV